MCTSVVHGFLVYVFLYIMFVKYCRIPGTPYDRNEQCKSEVSKQPWLQVFVFLVVSLARAAEYIHARKSRYKPNPLWCFWRRGGVDKLARTLHRQYYVKPSISWLGNLARVAYLD